MVVMIESGAARVEVVLASGRLACPSTFLRAPIAGGWGPLVTAQKLIIAHELATGRSQSRRQVSHISKARHRPHRRVCGMVLDQIASRLRTLPSFPNC